MTTRVAINGFGRIGRNILRALYESGRQHEIRVVTINDLGDPASNIHLCQYDSVHGRFNTDIQLDNDQMLIGDERITMLSEADPHALPWSDLNIDIVFECTGRFTSKKSAQVHLDQGAKRVLVSAPCSDADATIVYGVNHNTLNGSDRIISNASCTTNCLAPMAKILNDTIGIRQGVMTTIHAYTNDQHLSDTAGGDLYRARAAALSMIPTKTGAAQAVGLVLPEMNGKLTGMAVRVPTANVSLVDLSFIPERDTDVDEINQLMQAAALDQYHQILHYNELPLVSVDFNHHPASCIFDSTQTLHADGLVKVFAWYDNEWGFSNRMLDTCQAIAAL